MQRRSFVQATGGLLLASGPLARYSLAQEAPRLSMPSDACRPTIRLTTGPYFTLDSMRRSDIREDRSGVPFRLSFMVLDDFRCTPLEGVAVDVWHSDADGLYSGVVNEFFDHATLELSGEQVDMRSRPSFLRGHQLSDSQGRAEFATIYPGWYSGRLPHIHVRALVAGAEQWSAFFTQLFLPPEIDRFVYAQAPYAGRGFYPMTVERDLVLRGDAAARAKLTIDVERTGEGLHGRAVLAI
jgi:protocatechuate 3,4-dioxygenase beta subunit